MEKGSRVAMQTIRSPSSSEIFHFEQSRQKASPSSRGSIRSGIMLQEALPPWARPTGNGLRKLGTLPWSNFSRISGIREEEA